MMRWLICAAMFLSLTTILPTPAAAADPNEPPNIVFILIDDMGYADLPCYGSDFNETPNIDRLAQNGLRFTCAYSAGPVCSPTRAALVTGQYPVRSGITDFIAGNNPTIWLDPARYATINEPLQQAGYATCHLGKWHLDGGHAAGLGAPTRHGFDQVIGNETAFIGLGYYLFPYKHVSTFTEPVVPNPWLSGDEKEYLMDRLFYEAIGFMKQNKDEPFFVNLCLYSVHTDFEAPDRLVEKYIAKYEKRFGEGSGAPFRRRANGHRARWTEINNAGIARNCEPVLAAMVESIDMNIGKLVEALQAMGELDNTLIVIMSDNGGLPVNNNGGLREGKSWLYEGGIRVPLIMYWPQGIRPGGETDVPVNVVDMYPTFAELAGAALPKDQAMDGESLVGLMRDGKALQRQELYWHYGAPSANWVNRKATAIRQGDWKCIHWYAGRRPRVELFHLRDDPFEKHDLSQANPQKRRELMARIEAWRRECGVDIEKGLPDFPRPGR